MRRFTAVIVFLLALLPAVSIAQGFNPAGAPPVLYADNYGRWVLPIQNANTYTFTPASICQITQLNWRNKPTFFAFSQTVAAAPVLIADVNSTNSEVVTPGTLPTQTANVCAVSLSPANSHTTATLQSGTGGLQEALNAAGGQTGQQPMVIYITPEWYKLIQGIASLNTTLSQTATPAAIFANATCNTSAIVVDITAVPQVEYSCVSGKLQAIGATANSANLRVTSLTQIAAPTALSTSSTTTGIITTSATGGTIAAGTYRLAATCVDASGGETLISTDSASTATIATSGTTSTISVTSPGGCTLANGAVGWRLYMTAASGGTGTEILYSPSWTPTVSYPLQTTFPTATVIPIGSTATITAVVTGTATVPATGSAYPRTTGASEMYPPFTALGTVASAATGTLGLINLPAGALNMLGRQLTICGNGFATNNNTTGTVAVAAKLFSVPGVTSITPWTVSYTTATTTAVQVPINFCFTLTTAATGSSGTLEAHGWLSATTATAGAGVAGVIVNDNIFTVSSAVDLTKQLQIDFTITPTTTGLTAAQLRQVSIVSSN